MLKIKHPEIFKPFDFINAVFTESNRENHNSDRHIPGLNFGINTVEDISVIENNIHLLRQSSGLPTKQFAIARQTHSNKVKYIEKSGIYNDTDGLITNKKLISLGIQVADCAAVLVADVNNRIIGALHAGWRGAADHIIVNGLNKMKSLSDKEPNFKVFISPCISLKNFEVGKDVAKLFPDQFCDYESFQKPHVDLKAFIINDCITTGVKPEDIEVADYCTVEDTQYYSHRREREKAGRMLACIVLTK